MTANLGQRFAAALNELENTRDVDRMAELFADGAELRRIPQARWFSGKNGAREFWREYLHAYGEIQTEFKNVLDRDNQAVLEWHSRGRAQNGRTLEYDGVSIVESDDDGRITAFRAYYDGSQAVGVAKASS